MDFVCLGLDILGYCKYDPQNPAWKIISIGDTIAAVSLLVAFSQLLTPTKKEIVFGSLKAANIFWGIAVFFILIASVLPLIPGEAVPLLGYPIFWELIGALLMIFGIGMLLFRFFTPLTYSPRSGLKKIIAIAERLVAKGSEKDLAEFASELIPVIKKWVKDFTFYDAIEKYELKNQKKPYKVPEVTKDSIQLIRILSDKDFCSAVARKEPAFLTEIFSEFKAQDFDANLVRSFVWEVTEQCLRNKDSILYRELSYTGLGFSKEFTSVAFGDHQTNERLLPLSFWHPIIKSYVDAEMFECYSKTFLILTRAYVKSEDFYQHSFAIYTPGKTMVEYVEFLFPRIDSHREEDLSNSLALRCMSISVRTIKDVIEQVERNKTLNSEEYQSYASGLLDEEHDYTIFEMISEWSFSILKAASYTRKYDSEIRFPIIDLWLSIFDVGKENPTQFQIRKRLEKKIMKLVRENFERGFYPAITRVIISLNGLYINPQQEGFQKEFMEYLANNFHDVWKKDAEKALHFIPANTIYSDEQSVLIQTVRKGQERTLKIKKS